MSGDSLNPALSFADAASGQYDIWIGSYTSSETIAGSLAVLDESRSGNNASETVSGTARLDLTADPYFGSISLTAGFTPDPHTRRGTGGGTVDVSAASYGNECRGHASAAPDFQLNWSGSSSRLQIYFVAEDNSDATLIINTPAGSCLCNDDAPGTLNPGLTF